MFCKTKNWLLIKTVCSTFRTFPYCILNLQGGFECLAMFFFSSFVTCPDCRFFHPSSQDPTFAASKVLHTFMELEEGDRTELILSKHQVDPQKCLPHCLYSCHRNSCLWFKSRSCLLGSMFWLRMFDCLFGGCHLLTCSPNAHDSQSSSRISNSSSGCSAGICQKGGNCSCQERPMATPVYTKRCVKKGLLGFIGDKMKKVTQVTWTFLQYPNIFRDKSAWFRLKWMLHVSPTCFNM